jgi:hypothetical protein
VISPDETYLILPGKKYLVSFRDQNDNWSELMDIGIDGIWVKSGWCPSISSDGKFIFFSAYPKLKFNKYFDKRRSFSDLQETILKHPVSNRTDIYWISAKILENLRPDSR